MEKTLAPLAALPRAPLSDVPLPRPLQMRAWLFEFLNCTSHCVLRVRRIGKQMGEVRQVFWQTPVGVSMRPADADSNLWEYTYDNSVLNAHPDTQVTSGIMSFKELEEALHEIASTTKHVGTPPPAVAALREVFEHARLRLSHLGVGSWEVVVDDVTAVYRARPRAPNPKGGDFDVYVNGRLVGSDYLLSEVIPIIKRDRFSGDSRRRIPAAKFR